jgi:hypothetical protein
MTSRDFCEGGRGLQKHNHTTLLGAHLLDESAHSQVTINHHQSQSCFIHLVPHHLLRCRLTFELNRQIRSYEPSPYDGVKFLGALAIEGEQSPGISRMHADETIETTTKTMCHNLTMESLPRNISAKFSPLTRVSLPA